MATPSPHSHSSLLQGNVSLPHCPPADRISSAARRAAPPVSFKLTLDELTSCAVSRDIGTGSHLHSLIIKSGFGSGTIIGNSLLNMYSKCGSVDSARRVFDEMPLRTVVSWTTLMSGYCNCGEFDMAITLFGRMLGELEANEFAISVLLKACAQCADASNLRLVEAAHCYALKRELLLDPFLLNSLVDSYAKCGGLGGAEEILYRSDCRDVVSWTSLISGAVLSGYVREALSYFFKMQEDGKIPNEITVLSLLRACSSIGELELFRWVHGVIMKSGWSSSDFVVNSLMEMYLANGLFLEAIEVFCKFIFSSEDRRHVTAETVAVILQGCSRLGLFGLGKQIHCYLIKQRIIPSLVIENSLIDMYARNESMQPAFQIFSRMASKDIVSWNTIITCLVSRGDYSEALLHFRDIYCREDGKDRPDFVTVLGVLEACSDMSSYHLGQIIHGFLTKTGLLCDKFVQNSMIDMYGKAGRLNLAQDVFKDMLTKDLGSWNTIIGASGFNGDGHTAMKVFRELIESRSERPDEITFVNILAACAHTGMVEEGLEIFNSMEEEYGIRPTSEHFACVVDMLGRSGRLDEAEAFIRSMPVRPDAAVWGALLSSCSVFGRADLAERAAGELMVLDPKNKVSNVALSNVYAGVGRWEDVAKVRLEMKELNGKDAGWSSVEVRGEYTAFTVNDTRHPKCKLIYEALNSVISHISDTVHVQWTA